MSLSAHCRREDRAGGFTILEMLMAVALIGVATTLFVITVQSLGRAAPADDLEATFWKAMAEARSQALTSRRPTELRYDPEHTTFLVRAGGNETPFAAPTEAVATGDKVEVEFTEDKASNEFTLVRGEMITTRPIGAVKVFPDGTCQPFNVEFRIGIRKQRVKIDPWTGAAVLSDADARRGGP